MLDLMMRRKNMKTLDARLDMMVENAYYQCKPPEVRSVVKRGEEERQRETKREEKNTETQRDRELHRRRRRQRKREKEKRNEKRETEVR